MWVTPGTDMEPGQDPGALVTAQAIGVLVLALRVTPDAASRALQEAARRHVVAVEALAVEVVARAGGLGSVDACLSQAVGEEWGDLLD